jgi:TRAP-type C4-dicarboxylate transport system permease small subunit
MCAIMLALYAGSAATDALPWSGTALSWLGLALVLASILMFQVILIYALWRVIRGQPSGPEQQRGVIGRHTAV